MSNIAMAAVFIALIHYVFVGSVDAETRKLREITRLIEVIAKYETDPEKAKSIIEQIVKSESEADK